MYVLGKVENKMHLLEKDAYKMDCLVVIVK